MVVQSDSFCPTSSAAPRLGLRVNRARVSDPIRRLCHASVGETPTGFNHGRTGAGACHSPYCSSVMVS